MITREEKLKILAKLDPKLQDWFFSESMAYTIDKIKIKYGLSEDQISVISDIISDIVLGVLPLASLAQEINLKVALQNQQAAADLIRELNAEIFNPIAAMLKTAQPPISPPATVKMPQPAASPAPAVSHDQYREPFPAKPEIVDLRKTPPSPMPMHVTAAPIPPKPIPSNRQAAPPLTFTKPIEPVKPPAPAPTPMPMIEAEPHFFEEAPKETLKEALPPKSTTPPLMPKPENESKPQFTIRPPGIAPTPAPPQTIAGASYPRDILDLRKDKGEF